MLLEIRYSLNQQLRRPCICGSPYRQRRDIYDGVRRGSGKESQHDTFTLETIHIPSHTRSRQNRGNYTRWFSVDHRGKTYLVEKCTYLFLYDLGLFEHLLANVDQLTILGGTWYTKDIGTRRALQYPVLTYDKL